MQPLTTEGNGYLLCHYEWFHGATVNLVPQIVGQKLTPLSSFFSFFDFYN